MDRVNRAVGFGRFLRSIGETTPWPPDPVDESDQRRRTSSMVPPSASNFEDFLEPGIRALVVALVQGWNCTTFSSCQGHLDQIAGVASQATVGIVAADEEELKRLVRLGNELAESISAIGTVMESCQLVAQVNPLETAVGEVPVVELWFIPTSGWTRYFADLTDRVALAARHVDIVARG